MKKAIIYGAAFGFVFGLIEFLTLGFDLSLYWFTGTASLAAYIVILILVLKQTDNHTTYGKRFLRGLVFSLAIGLVYGILAGIANFIFAENVAKTVQEGLEMFKQIGVDSSLLENASTEPTPVANLIGEFFGAIFFNLFCGAIFSSIFASFIKPKTSSITQPVTPIVESV